MRKLASIQRIVDVRPIEGADRIEVATVLGWECVIKKDEFKPGDLVVYIEIDSKLPDIPPFEFMRERKFRVRTIKLRKQVSQGLIVPLSVLPSNVKVEEDLDVTEILGITKYDPEGDKERKLLENKLENHNNKVVRFLSKYNWFKKLFKPKKAGFPSFIKKTDETRIQNIPRLFVDKKGLPLVVTEKLDGQSATFFLVRNGRTLLGKKKYVFGVCSRNLLLPKPDNSSYWTIARTHNIEKALRNMIGYEKYVILQGEIIGEGIQGNKYGVSGYRFYAFNLIYPGKNVDSEIAREIIEQEDLEFVPILGEYELPETVGEVVNFAKGKSVLNNRVIREGLVMRNYQEGISFKAINPDFLLKNEE